MTISRRLFFGGITAALFTRRLSAQDPANYPNTRMAAEAVAKRLGAHSNPIVVLMIIQIIVSVISILQRYCQEKAQDVPALAKRVKERKTLFDRRRWRVFRRAVINEIGMEEYRVMGEEKLLNALLDEAIEDIDAKMIESLYRESTKSRI